MGETKWKSSLPVPVLLSGFGWLFLVGFVHSFFLCCLTVAKRLRECAHEKVLVTHTEKYQMNLHRTAAAQSAPQRSCCERKKAVHFRSVPFRRSSGQLGFGCINFRSFQQESCSNQVWQRQNVCIRLADTRLFKACGTSTIVNLIKFGFGSRCIARMDFQFQIFLTSECKAQEKRRKIDNMIHIFANRWLEAQVQTGSMNHCGDFQCRCDETNT